MMTFFLVLIFLISVASTWWFGLWSNLITLVNLILAGLIATSFYENANYELLARMRSFYYVLPFVTLWLLFGLSFMILRGLTDFLSSMRLKFDPITELVGRSLLSLMVALVLISFVSFTLQYAPLRQSLFSDSPIAGAPLGPDKLWLGFVRGCSNGSLSYTAEETSIFPPYTATRTVNGQTEKFEVRSFDPTDSFFQKGSDLRDAISKSATLRVADDFYQATQ